ncbi:MAG: hypothetical protein IH956_10260 [Chloroflexi bacterium]|nr:hypothetical protein [Chloroflexota bacterium]
MARKLRSRGFTVLAGTMVVAGPVAAACAPGPTYDDWAATDGAAGRINLDEIQEAFKKSDSPTEFERRVNEIYEGDGLVLIRSSQEAEGLVLNGFEDLNGNGTIEDATDDLLFSIVNKDNNNELRGHGANGYYRSSFGGGNFLFTYLLISSLTGPRYYQTSPGRASTMRTSRANYRGSSVYRSQVSKNTRYFNRQKSFHGSRYTSASRNLSQGRTSYQSRQRSTSAFKSSKTGVRSSWGASSRSRGSGGFRGGGGAQVVIEPGRRF